MSRARKSAATRCCCLFNADHGTTVDFTLPDLEEHHAWELMLDSADTKASRERFEPGKPYKVKPCSVVALRDHAPVHDSTGTRVTGAGAVRWQDTNDSVALRSPSVKSVAPRP